MAAATAALTLDVGPGVALDLDDYEQSGLRIAIVGSSGSGKGWLLGVLIEALIENGVPVIMLDAEHELWTFKEVGAIVVGGPEGDAPFVEDNAAIDAAIHYALASRTPLVFDLHDIAEARESEAARLGERVMERVWRAADETRVRFAFAVTEASIFAPQAVPTGTRRPEMLRQFAQRGRKRGLTTLFETQRPADIQKAVLSQANVTFVGGLNKLVDFTPVAKEVGEHTFDEFRSLRTGDFYYAPSRRFVHVRARTVTHGGATPGSEGITLRAVRATPPDVAVVLAQLRDAAKPKPEPEPAPREAGRHGGAAPTGLVHRDVHDAAMTELRAARAKNEEQATRLRNAVAAEVAATAELSDAREREAALRAQFGEAEQLRDALRRFIGAGPSVSSNGHALATSGPSLAEITTIVRTEIQRAGGGGNGVSVMIEPTEALRERYLEAAAQRLIETVAALDDDARAAMLFLLAHPDEGYTVTSIAQALSGNDNGNTRDRWGKALAPLLKAGLAIYHGSGRAKRKQAAREWVASGLGPHAPTEDDIERVLRRALSVVASATVSA